jgi:hypothetical protein
MCPFSISCPADIGRDRTLLFWLPGSLTFEIRPRLRFTLHWLREVSTGCFGDELCQNLDSSLDASLRATLSGTLRAAIAVDEDGWLRLRLSMWRDSSLHVAAGTDSPRDPEPLARAILAFDPEAPPEGAARLASAILEEAFLAVEKKCAAELGRLSARKAALLDRSFDFTADGLAGYRAALEGSLAAAHLAESLESGTRIEVHLPFLGRSEWAGRWDALAGAKAVAEEDGRVFVHAGPVSGRERRRNACQNTLALAAPLLYPEATAGFEIGFTDSRTASAAAVAHWLPWLLRDYDFGPEPFEWLAEVAGGDVRASLSFGVPGSMAGAWLRAPGERDPEFFHAYSKVSLAVQRTVRRWLPYACLSDLNRFADTNFGYGLIFYRSTRPCGGRPRSDFAHDLVTPEDPGVARPWAWRPLAFHLACAERLLRAAGRHDLAHLYEPWRARTILEGIVRRPRFINALLAADAFLIDRLVSLGLAGREFPALHADGPRRAAKEVSAFMAQFSRAVNHKLWRIYAGQGFIAMGSLLLVEATRALAAVLDGQAAISVTLHLASGSRERTFVNAAFRR